MTKDLEPGGKISKNQENKIFCTIFAKKFGNIKNFTYLVKNLERYDKI